MLQNIAVALVDEVNAFELGVLCEVFGIDRSEQGLPVYDFAVVSSEPGPVRVLAGLTVSTTHGIERLEQADLIAVPAGGKGFEEREYPPALLEALRDAVAREARVLSVCGGAFVLGAAGLLDGRKCTTHWKHTDQLAARFPAARVEPDVLYIDEDPVITSAGTAAGIDACLHIVRKEQGCQVANAIARRMVVPPHREGGQAQYIERPVPPSSDNNLADVLAWMESHLDADVTVEQLASRAHMSPRTFARRFLQEAGTTPYRWLLRQRISHAQHLLETTDQTIDCIAACVGFGSSATLRHHFLRILGVTPQAYRRTFRENSDQTDSPPPADSARNADRWPNPLALGRPLDRSRPSPH
jgi:transcriptional regulator GlxA family with amidase domain